MENTEEIIKELTFEEEFPEYELDNNYKNHFIINSNEIDYSTTTTNGKKSKNKKSQFKTPVNLDTLTQNEGTKKWTSLRVAEKKPTIVIEKKRAFSPRLPPFLTLPKNNNMKKILNINNNEDFPTLN